MTRPIPTLLLSPRFAATALHNWRRSSLPYYYRMEPAELTIDLPNPLGFAINHQPIGKFIPDGETDIGPDVRRHRELWVFEWQRVPPSVP
jgi:hypothetical protein